MPRARTQPIVELTKGVRLGILIVFGCSDFTCVPQCLITILYDEGQVKFVKDSGEVEVRGDLEKAIRILKKKLAREGFFRELKKRRHYEKPSMKRRKKSQEAQKRRKKFERREATI